MSKPLSHVYNRYGLAEYHKRELCYPWTDRPAFLFWGAPETGPWRERDSPLHIWQDGRCGLCGFIERLVMDHDHRTGLERGLLCHSCNLSEGRHDPKIDPWRDGLNTAVTYGPKVYVNIFGETPTRAGRSPLSDTDLDLISAAVER